MSAYYNAPENDADLAASFHSQDEAEAYVDEYGGDINRAGVVFVVTGADFARAKDDAAKARADDQTQGPATTNEPLNIDALVAAKVAEALAQRDSERDAPNSDPASQVDSVPEADANAESVG
jgi:hypothetical protein